MNYNTILFIDGSKTSLLLYNEIRKKNKFNIKKIFDGIERLKEKSYLIIYKNYIFKIKSRIIKYEV